MAPERSRCEGGAPAAAPAAEEQFVRLDATMLDGQKGQLLRELRAEMRAELREAPDGHGSPGGCAARNGSPGGYGGSPVGYGGSPVGARLGTPARGGGGPSDALAMAEAARWQVPSTSNH